MGGMDWLYDVGRCAMGACAVGQGGIGRRWVRRMAGGDPREPRRAMRWHSRGAPGEAGPLHCGLPAMMLAEGQSRSSGRTDRLHADAPRAPRPAQDRARLTIRRAGSS